MLIATRPLDLRRLADTCAASGQAFAAVGADFTQAARMLDSRRLEQAEVALKRGLDRLARAIEDVPMVE
jgi:hypothetical protein